MVGVNGRRSNDRFEIETLQSGYTMRHLYFKMKTCFGLLKKYNIEKHICVSMKTNEDLFSFRVIVRGSLQS